jgi:hypothetical protein
LQSGFRILHQPAHLRDQWDLENIMMACIILHNMIVEDEKDDADDLDLNEPASTTYEDLDLNEPASTTYVQPPEINHNDISVSFQRTLEINVKIQHRSTHIQLRNDLVEHIWQKFGPSNIA